MTLAGIAFGLAGAVAVSRLLGSLLFEISPTDPFAYAAVIVALTLASLFACVLPAARAARIDPVVSLRGE